MIKEMGRLNLDDYKIMDAQVEKIFKSLDKGKREQAIKEIEEMANTANYFVREEMGKRLATYQGKGPLDEICAEMLDDFIYGIRATALFYFYYKRQDDPRVIVKTLEKTVETVPWESETICFELWKNYPEVMKEEMPHWAMSPNENKRSMSMHGMENIADKNPQYILTFIGRLLDDESEEVQKKRSATSSPRWDGNARCRPMPISGAGWWGPVKNGWTPSGRPCANWAVSSAKRTSATRDSTL